jgi:2-dehydro-3-deoxyphosphogluconate aldolase/(4S)-4-hydroxy-2-oxoglutarate aldolase
MNAAEAIQDDGAVVIIRLDDHELIIELASALNRGGIRCIEIPLTTPNAIALFDRLREKLGAEAVLGAGTVLDKESAAAVISAGARFVVSPHFIAGVVSTCRKGGVAAIPGAFSPAEIFGAWSAGADIVKVFPVRALGPAYLADILGPYPQVRLMPTGGVSLANAASFIKAGACAVTVGRDILGQAPWDDKALTAVADRARILLDSVRAGKKALLAAGGGK